jgi:hypothetical protein
LSAVEQDRGRHGQRHDQRDLPGTGPDGGDQQAGDAEADGDPSHQLDPTAQPLAKCDPRQSRAAIGAKDGDR